MATNEGQQRLVKVNDVVKQALTTAANGVFTAKIDPIATHVALTSGGATEYAVLPVCSADTIGRRVVITVGANGYELVTPDSSGNTVNLVDCDGTNQLDVAANTSLICEQVSATGWIALTVAATTVVATAPDND
jgi:hypothetical protein